MTNGTERSVATVATASNQIGQAASGLLSSANTLAGRGQQLESEVAKFVSAVRSA